MSMKVNVLTQELWVLSVAQLLVQALLVYCFLRSLVFHAHFGAWV
jgi:hypothetical protein